MPGTTDETVVRQIEPSPFAKLVTQIGNGAVEEELSSMLLELTERLRLLGGKANGAITLKIKFKLDRDTFDIDAAVTMTEPRTVHARTLMYPVVGGGVSRSNPHADQTDAFEARDVPHERAPARPLSISPTTARG